MQTETVEYREGDWDIEVVVSEATVLMGTRRMLLMSEAFEQDGDDFERRLLHRAVYPHVMAGTTEANGIPWPLAFEDAEAELDFVRLPDLFARDWEAAVLRLNPHWKPQARSKKD